MTTPTFFHRHDSLQSLPTNVPYPSAFLQNSYVLSEVRRIPCLVNICQHILQNLIPMYGPQEANAEKLAVRDDRNAFLIYYEGATPIGLFVQKIHLSDKYKEYGIERSLKIKTFLINPEFFGKGARSAVLEEALERAKMMETSSVYFPVSSLDQSNIEFFQHNDFSLIETVVGNCYGAERHKHLLFRNVE